MSTLYNSLEGFAPELYLATLVEVAHSDGLHPDEEALLQQQALNFGLNLASLPQVPRDLSQLPWATRVLVYRDALMLAGADSELSAKEQEYLLQLAQRLQLQEKVTREIAEWVNAYSNLLGRLEDIIEHGQADDPA